MISYEEFCRDRTYRDFSEGMITLIMLLVVGTFLSLFVLEVVSGGFSVETISKIVGSG